MDVKGFSAIFLFYILEKQVEVLQWSWARCFPAIRLIQVSVTSKGPSFRTGSKFPLSEKVAVIFSLLSWNLQARKVNSWWTKWCWHVDDVKFKHSWLHQCVSTFISIDRGVSHSVKVFHYTAHKDKAWPISLISSPYIRHVAGCGSGSIGSFKEKKNNVKWCWNLVVWKLSSWIVVLILSLQNNIGWS